MPQAEGGNKDASRVDSCSPEVKGAAAVAQSTDMVYPTQHPAGIK